MPHEPHAALNRAVFDVPAYERQASDNYRPRFGTLLTAPRPAQSDLSLICRS
jgi:hypothetical protein